MRSILFCNEMLGMGHLRLSLVFAEALVACSEGATALVVTGSPAFGGMRVAPGVDILKLPVAPVTSDSRWSATEFRPSAGLAMGHKDVGALRAHLSLAAIECFRPDVLVSDHRPLGREDELQPALEYLRARGGCTIALGLWEVDDDPERLRAEWGPKLMDTVGRLYDLAFVYGPPWAGDVRVERLQAAGVPVYHTGLIGLPPAKRGASDLGNGYLLVMAGGGVDGFVALDAVIGAIRTQPIEVPAVLVTGPLMGQSQIAMLRKHASGLEVQVLEFRADIDAVIAGARAIVAMAGYCTVSEVLASGKPALLIPRVFPREEQLNRARRLVAAGRVEMLLPNELAPIRVRDAIGKLLKRQPTTPEPLRGAIDAANILTRVASQGVGTR